MAATKLGLVKELVGGYSWTVGLLRNHLEGRVVGWIETSLLFERVVGVLFEKLGLVYVLRVFRDS
jgi:hypothetical protein